MGNGESHVALNIDVATESNSMQYALDLFCLINMTEYRKRQYTNECLLNVSQMLDFHCDNMNSIINRNVIIKSPVQTNIMNDLKFNETIDKKFPMI